MKRETKNQMFTIFVLLIFLGSSIAFALMSIIPTQKQEVSNVFNRPLSEQEEAQIIKQNKVVVKFFYHPTCQTCISMEPVLDEIITEFRENLATERINIQEFEEQVAENDIQYTPTFIFKGKSIERIDGATEKEELVKTICSLYFELPDVCL